jgi:hypothetical protein
LVQSFLRTARTSIIGLLVAGASACTDPAKEHASAAVHPTYDKTTGRLKELTYDANGNGRIDTWTEMDGTRPLRSRVDTNEDGKIDRWEEYDQTGGLAKVGFSRADNGKADAWVFSGAGGKLDHIEISSKGDPQSIDRWEYYDASRADRDAHGALVRAEEDTNGDGRPDKWETYEQGVMKTVAFDENGDGRPDRRVNYSRPGLVVIESHPDASGRFAKRIEVK